MAERTSMTRFWYDESNGCIVRQWTDEEYETVNPETPIVELHWYNVCPCCGVSQYVVASEEEAKLSIHRCDSCSPFDPIAYRGYTFGPIVMRCMEHGEIYMEEIDMTTERYKRYE